MWLDRLVYVLSLRWRALVGRRQAERDLDDEIRDHLERQVEEWVRNGADPADARRAALRAFGGVEQVKEHCRDARGFTLLETLLQDVRYALRTLRRNPGFGAVATLTLAIGIGGTAAVYSVVDAVLVMRLPYSEPERLVSITGTYPGGAFAAMRESAQTLDVAAYADGHWFTLSGAGEPTRVAGARISAELFQLLGVEPALGVWLRPGQDAAPDDRYVILSHALWAAAFRADEGIIGRSIDLDGVRREVIAVMPPSFRFPALSTELWVPLGLEPSNAATYWAGDFMPVVGRLRPGVPIAQAHAEIRLFQSMIGRQFPWSMPPEWNRDVAVIPLQDALVQRARPRLLLLMMAVALVLVIACANVASLNVSRAVARGQEMAVRAALGAGPRRLARQLLTESVLLATVSGVVGLLLAVQAIAVLALVLPADTPRLSEAHVNWRVLVLTGAVTLVAGCASGLVPVVQSLRLGLETVLRGGGREGRPAAARPLRSALTIAQIAGAVVLVIAAGLLVRSVWRLSGIDPGFRSDGLVTARVSPTESLCGSAPRCFVFYRRLEEDVQAHAGVEGAALVNTLPLTRSVAKRSLEIDGQMAPGSLAPLFWLHVITPDYFRVMEIPLEAGRAFTREDLAGGAPVAIVSATTARRFWPGEPPVGSRVRFAGESHWRTVVGVAADVRAHDLTRDAPGWIDGILYVPHNAGATLEDGRIATDMSLAIRTTQDPTSVAAMLREVASRTSGGVAISEVREMRALLADVVAAPAATASLLVTMGGVALVLGCTGVYGVIALLVSGQTRALGIRLALGAERRDVFWLIIKEGAALCGAGVALGMAGAVAATRWLASELYGISSTDPVTYAAVALLVSVVTLLACYVPTRRAMRLDPLMVLREP